MGRLFGGIVCTCGHTPKQHRSNGTCKKCECEKYKEADHPKDCRCNKCLWDRVLGLEEKTRLMTKHIEDEMTPAIDELETVTETLVEDLTEHRKMVRNMVRKFRSALTVEEK